MRHRLPIVAAVLLLAALGLLLWNGSAAGVAPAATTAAGAHGAVAEQGNAAAGAAAPAPGAAVERAAVATAADDTGVRGIVLDAKNGQPLAGVEVVATRQLPSFEPLMQRFRGLFQSGMWSHPLEPVQVLGRTLSSADGTFEIRGLPAGRVFLDGRSDGWFVRTPGAARLARGELVSGIELRASPGGRVRGVVVGADGAPAAGAQVTLRPGLNAFLGQITERKYRWLETTTDAMGRFDLPGVPTGSGYTISASAPFMALEEQFGLAVAPGQVTDVLLHGHLGATVSGRVLDGDGAAVANANVAMVYLDLSRVLFSADGRDQPVTTDSDGRFRIEHVGAGRVAFIAAADAAAPSRIEERAVVDGGVYNDVELRLGEGVTVTGVVVDDQQQPIAGAAVEVRPLERPNDPQFLKMLLQIRRVEVATGADGRFTAKGLSGDRLLLQAKKAGYTTTIKSGVKLDDKSIELQLQRGAVVQGKVSLPDGQPATRFRVQARSQPVPKPAAKPGETAAADTASPPADDQGGFRARFGRGGRDWNGGTVQLPEGQTMLDRNPEGNWREISASDGAFRITGLPPGRITVQVRADGLVDAANKEVDLAAGQSSDVLEFTLQTGLTASGTVVDGATGKPVGDAQVTAYKQKPENKRRGPFDFQFDREDFDFMALASTQNQHSTVTDSHGSFRLEALEPGKYRFTARHPDLAKASAKDVELVADKPATGIEIKLDAGGGVEGAVTGVGQRPLADALIVALSLQAGSFKSATTDKAGFYRIDGLPPGQYVVFKSRLDERADNIPLELMSNMRLKTVTVRQGKFTRLDVQDDSDDGVRVFGVVREAGAPVPRALVTVLGADKDGFLGMGVRANSSRDDGRYELLGIKPGSYLFQISRFRGRPLQTTLSVDVPDGQRDFQLDLDLPTSEVSGRVVDTRGQPVAGMQVALGSEQSGLGTSDGLLGLLAQGGFGQARTDDQGQFKIASVAAGTYRLTAGSRLGPGRRGGGNDKYGEASLPGIVVDGTAPVAGLLVTVPLAGRIHGIVVDGSNQPVAGAEIHFDSRERSARPGKRNPMLDMLGAQARPIASGSDGQFDITGLTPSVYDLRADAEGLDAGKVGDVQVVEDQTSEVTIRIVRGAQLRLRATNVDRSQIPLANLSLLDGQGHPVVNKVSSLTVMRRLMGNRDKVEDSGWYEFGNVPPDTYTVVVAQPGEEDIRITRTVIDGEHVEWDIDVAAELAARRTKKQ